MANVINIGGGAGGSSGGGHTILDNDGTSLTQRAELQFKGAYSEDNSTDEVTEVNVIRSMTKAEFDLLSADEKQGIINVTDESGEADRNYSETTLWSGSETPSPVGTQITLSDNISNYDEIVFVMDTDYVGSNSFLVSQLTIGETYIATIYAPSNYGAYWSYDSDTTVTIKSQASASLKTYTKVIGIKYGNGTQTFHTYSTAEKIVGEWIDGSALYEKTVQVLGLTLSNNATTDITITDYISNFGYAISLETVCVLQNSQYLTLPYYAGGQYVIEAFFNGATTLSVYRNGGQITVDMYFTIRYTKTST